RRAARRSRRARDAGRAPPPPSRPAPPAARGGPFPRRARGLAPPWAHPPGSPHAGSRPPYARRRPPARRLRRATPAPPRRALRPQVVLQLVAFIPCVPGPHPEVAEQPRHRPHRLARGHVADEDRRLLILHRARGPQRRPRLLLQRRAKVLERSRLQLQRHLLE